MMNNNGTVIRIEEEAHMAMNLARELAAERKKKKKGEQDAELELRRILITNMLQRYSVSINSLQMLAINKTRHEEKCQAIPEGNEDEEEDDDEDNDDDNGSILRSLSATTTTDLEKNSDSNSNSECNYNCDMKKGTGKQIEQRRRPNAFYRMKRFVGAKSVVAKSA